MPEIDACTIIANDILGTRVLVGSILDKIVQLANVVSNRLVLTFDIQWLSRRPGVSHL